MSNWKKKVRNQQQKLPTPAAPAQPDMSHAQFDKQVNDRIETARLELYRLRHGDILDKSIERWQRTLRIYDREAEALEAKPPEKQHRWTISPSMALRAEVRLEKLLAQQEQLLDECHAEAARIVQDYYEQQMEAASLCPPKETPAPMAESEAEQAENEEADPPIAA
jgi:hypothetical protein